MADRAQEAETLARLWRAVGGDERASGLSRDRIVGAAIALADDDGLAAVSMAAVARSLGAGTMSLYRHVANKDELLLLMHEAVWRINEDVRTFPSADGWRADLARWYNAQLAVMQLHPWLDYIRLRQRAGTPSQVEWLEAGLQCLAGTGLTAHDATEVLLLLAGHAFWEARYGLELAAAEAEGGDVGGHATFGSLLRSVADPARYPALRRAVDAGVFDVVRPRSRAEFGLERILDGVEQIIPATGRGAADTGDGPA